MRIVDGRPVMLQAHRGNSAECPENTMVAFLNAACLGYDVIELNPKFTRDNHCVILHDRTIGRTARGAGGRAADSRIADLTLDEARAYEYGSWFNEEFTGERLPLLEEALNFARERNVALKLDNVIESFAPEQTEMLFDLIEKTGMQALAGFTCTRPDYIAAVSARFPESVVHYDGPAEEDRLRAAAAALRNNPLVVWLRYPNRQSAWCNTPPVSDERLALARSLGARVGLWIIDDEDEFSDACARFQPDIVETSGFIKPDKALF